MKTRAALALLALAPLSATAQTETGTRLGGRPAQRPDSGSNAQMARVWLDGDAACMVGRDSKGVSLALDAPFANEDAALRRLSRMSVDDCLSNSPSGFGVDELRLSEGLLRGALYANRVSRTVDKLTPEMLPQAALPVPDLTSDPGKAPRVAVIRFGECVVRDNPAGSLAFVKARVATSLESDALAALGPSLSKCVTAGTAVKMTKSSVEAALAEAIYRMKAASEAATRTSGN